MSRETELRPRRRLAGPELDVEQEVDLGRYGRQVAARWWLPLAGLLAGLLLGYLLGQGSSRVYRADALLYLGQPFSPNGGSPVQSLATNPSSVGRIVRSEAALREAAGRSDLRVGKLRGNVSTKPVSAGRGASRAGQSQLVEIAVKGETRKVERATNALAERVVRLLAGYVDDKIGPLERRLEGQNRALASLERRRDVLEAAVGRSRGLSVIERLFLVSQLDNAEQRRTQLIDNQAATQQQLSLARNVERPQIVEKAVANETTARSTRNSMLAGGLLGLIGGVLAALFWEPLSGRLNRPAA